jgi:hypothetical protein
MQAMTHPSSQSRFENGPVPRNVFKYLISPQPGGQWSASQVMRLLEQLNPFVASADASASAA